MPQEIDIILDLLFSVVKQIVEFHKNQFVEKCGFKLISNPKYRDGLLVLQIIFEVSTMVTGSRTDEVQLSHTVKPNIDPDNKHHP